MAALATVNTLDRRPQASLAYARLPAALPGRPGLMFLTGFRSAMTGLKALAVEAAAQAHGLGCVRFDYSGHGASEGRFEDGTIGQWLADALDVLDRVTEGPQVLVGSSMGGWLAVQAALARPERVAAIVTVAAAPDFTELLLEQEHPLLEREGAVPIMSPYEPEPYQLTWRLVAEARQHLVLDGRPISLACPLRLIHGLDDAEVPWGLSLKLAEAWSGSDVRLTLVKGGDHRLSRPEDLALLQETVVSVAGGTGTGR